MILLDTNVISEPLRPAPHPKVVSWLDSQNIETLFLAAISLAELRFGVEALPNGKRKTSLRANLENRVLPLFRGRILPFDEAASRAYAELRTKARKAGKDMGIADGYIAATAAANGLTVATRDTRPFAVSGLEVVNPWKI